MRGVGRQGTVPPAQLAVAALEVLLVSGDTSALPGALETELPPGMKRLAALFGFSARARQPAHISGRAAVQVAAGAAHGGG